MKRREEEREEEEEEEEEEREEEAEKEDIEEEGEEELEEEGEEGAEEEEEEEGAEEEGTLAEGDGDEVEVDDEDVKKKKSSKQVGAADRKCVPGIIYLGHIPPRLRPKHLRNMLSVYGEVGRVFLQPEDGQVKKRKRKSRCDFTEGWVEFTDKRVAKRVAASLHNTPMGTRKRQRFASDLWSIKYLHRFHWTHLSERLAYEKTVLQQRLRTEVSQAKKETNFYLNNVERSAQMEKGKKKRRRDGEQVEEKTWDFTQRQTEEEIQHRKKKRKNLDKARLIQQKSQSNVSLLAKIFNSNKSE